MATLNKRNVLALAALLSAGVTAARAQQPDAARPPGAPVIERLRLTEGVWVFRVPSELDVWTAANTTVFVNGDDVLVFDPNARPSVARQVIAQIRALTPKPVRWVVNSHWHMDHWMSNAEYAAAFPGVQFIATTETRDYMRRFTTAYFVQSAGEARRRAQLDSAVRRGTLADGSPLTPVARQAMEADIRAAAALAADIGAVRQVLPTLTFSDSLVLYAGGREFRFYRATGDASGSAVLYVPGERILATGDALVRREDGTGAQPWTTNSYLIRPWLRTLRGFDALEVAAIVPGQGPPLFDKDYLRRTIELYESIITQVDAALAGGATRFEQVRERVNLAPLRARFTQGDATLGARFDAVTLTLIRKTIQESLDGVNLP